MTLANVRRMIILAALVAASFVYAWDPPPLPSSSGANAVTVDALGGIVRTQGLLVGSPGSGSGPVNIISALGPGGVWEETAPIPVTLFRKIVVTRVTATDPTDVACVRLGPDVVDPGNGDGLLTCFSASVANAGGTTGGCYLQFDGDTCEFLIRRQTTGCSTWADCVPKLWSVNSDAGNQTVLLHVGVSW